MKCPYCNGKGYYEAESSYGTERVKCHCQRKMTNEEWLRQATTEQLAEWMVMLQLVGVHPIKRGSIDTGMFIADTVEWLKQPHTPKE